MDDLDNYMLTQILFRLPSCKFIVGCKLVSKRWCSLISNPTFAYHFSNHKKEITSDEDELRWTFITNIGYVNVHPQYQYCMGNVSTNEAEFGSAQFSMGFLSGDFNIEATFKDLVLCSGKKTSRGDRVYYIANPLTKQWVALPPCPVFSKSWVEIGEWKKFKLGVPIKVELAAENSLYNNDKFQGVVCNSIVYLHQRLYFAPFKRLYFVAFNPFDVDETTDTTIIEAKVLPSLPDPVNGYLLESSGQLFIMHNRNKEYHVCCQKRGKAIEIPLVIWKLDPNQVPLIWKRTFYGSCTGNANKIESPSNITLICNINLWNLWMHPKNDKLIYMHLWREEQLVLCDTQTRLIKPLKSLPGENLETFHRLEFQWWPTSVPKAYLSDWIIKEVPITANEPFLQCCVQGGSKI